MTNAVLTAALAYAARGWLVHPTVPGEKAVRTRWRLGEADPAKLPAAHRGMSEDEWWRTWGDIPSSSDTAVIRAWWSGRPDSGVGVQTGRGSGLVIIDVDHDEGVDGEATLARLELELERGALPATVEQTTPRGGRQLLFRYPEAWRGVVTRAGIGGQTPRERTGLDVRGDGGQALLPPTKRGPGAYAWKAEHVPGELDLAELPEGWRTLFEPAAAPPQRPRPTGPGPRLEPGADGTAYGLSALERACDELAGLRGRGGRDQLAFRVAVRLLGLELGGELAGGVAEQGLCRALDACGYMDDPRPERGERGLRRIMASAGRKARPEVAPPRPERRAPPRRGPSSPTDEARVVPTTDNDCDGQVDGEDDEHPTDDGFPKTDLGNAERLLRDHGEDLLYSFPPDGFDDWLVWNGKYWRIGDRAEVERRAARTARKLFRRALAAEGEGRKAGISFAMASEGLNRRRAMLESAKCRVEVGGVDGLDADGMLLNTPTGTVDLRTGELRPHRREDRITKITGVAFDPSADAPTWDAFLDCVFGGDRGLVATVQRHLGYAITGEVGEEVIAIYHGGGANGKTTLINAVAHVLGDYYRQLDTAILVETKNGGSKADIEKANLRGVRLAMCAETSQVRTVDDGLLKQITSNDRIVGKFLYQNTISFKPTHKPVLVTNHRPVVKTTDEGTWRRILLFPFRVTIPKAERDKALGAKLRAEAPGILAWLVRGALEWQARGLDPCKAVLDETSAYRDDQDYLSDFIAARCVRDPSSYAASTELYKAYGAWVEEATGGKASSQTTFGEAMIERGFERRKVGTKRYIGIRLMTPLEVEAAKIEATRDTRDTRTLPEQKSLICTRDRDFQEEGSRRPYRPYSDDDYESAEREALEDRR